MKKMKNKIVQMEKNTAEMMMKSKNRKKEEDVMVRILIVFLFLSFCIFFGISYSQETGHIHEPHTHKHKQYATVKNPIPMSEQSIEKGREAFGKHCDACHGERGTEAIKVNLMDDVVIHGDTDGEIYHVITDGVKETSMKGFKKELTNEMRWNLVNYIKSLRPISAAGKASARPGKQIRQTNIEGYNLTYHLLNLLERSEMMKLMEGHSVLGMKKITDTTNHLMVYVEKPDGKIVSGDVAFLLTGPDGKDFRTVTMEMYGGYGADISLKLKGIYKIRTKIVIESGKVIRLDDEFTFEVK